MNIEVSAFKKVTDSNNPYNRDIFKCLERIKLGASKDKIEAYRSTGDSSIKSSLTGYCFSGTFSNRSKAGLKKHSGLIILDFDKFESVKEALEFKDSISDLDFVFSAFISPSGNGLKVLVKIPPVAADHELYYNAIFKYFDNKHLDKSGKDVSRFCFESYDPDIYINKDSVVWETKEEKEAADIGGYSSDIIVRLDSDHEIIKRLQIWFDKKHGASNGNRNTNLFMFASALHDFGISQSTTENHLFQYVESDFTQNEITRLVKSAYDRNPENFNTKAFEDNKLRDEIEKKIRSGKKLSTIKKEINIKNIDSVVEDIKEDLQVSEFWYYDDKNKIRLSPHKYKFWLEQNNFLKFFPTDSGTFTFIKKEQNLIEETNEKRIKDYVLEELLNKEKIGFKPYDFMAGNPNYFNINYLSMLKSENVDIKEDTKDECFLYYKNCAVKITKDNVEEIDYLSLDGFVWKNQIIDRDFVRSDHHDSEFRTFLWLISGKDQNKYNSFKSVIGYLLHSYKTSSKNKAIILNDETISDNPNGGSGKGLLWNALSKMKKVSMIDGKTFEFNKSFPYQTVSTDSQVLVFDDVKKNFSFESLFSVITEGITLEYKGQDAIKIPVEKSPKILITTNYTIGGVGGSFDRRKFEVEMSDYFNSKYTPEDEFGHMLFDDWSADDWVKFDNYMINCLQGYLSTGLVAHDFNNLETRKFIKTTNMEFYEWSKDGDNLEKNTRLYKGDLYNNFIIDYPDYGNGKYKLSQKKFRNYLEEFSKFYDYKYTEDKDHNGRWCQFDCETTNSQDKEDSLNF